jgi:hypothetical protein
MRVMRIWVSIVATLWMSPALAQATLGALLDSGATRLSAVEFRNHIEQRMVAGPLPTGGDLEVMYATNGKVVGRGKSPNFFGVNAPIGGDWKFDELERVCSSISIQNTPLPYRCQYWFKLGDKYFIADSDTDRSAKVLVRTIKQ